MESSNSDRCGSCSGFGFGFNDPNFSDRILLVKLIPESTRSKPDPVQDSIGHEVVQGNGTCSMDYSATTTKTIHITSLILAAKSPFFHKLFSNGMAESNQRLVTLHIQESEEAAFMDLLKFMYTSTLNRTTTSDLLDVLVAADKYEVASCMKYCFHLLQKLPMTFESALLYLDFPSTILMDDTVQPLKDSAKKFLVARFKDINMFQEELLNLPLAGLEPVLSSDDLQVSSEDEIYDFVMKWAQRHHTKPAERREMLTTRLLCLIRFSFMSRSKLEEVLTCTDINLEHRSKLVFEAISLETSHRELPPVKEQERAYKLRPVKVTRFHSPREECVVYLDLKHEECAGLLSSKILSRPFDFGGEAFHLMAERNEQSFGFFVCRQEIGSIGVEFKFASRKKPIEEFKGDKSEVYNKFPSEVINRGFFNLYGVPWDTFIATNSPHFINGVLHLRAELRILKE